MLVNSALKTVAPFVPVVGSAYGFGKTCIRVYKSSSPSAAIIAGVKGILINCTPPVIKYPLLCAGALACGGAACVKPLSNNQRYDSPLKSESLLKDKIRPVTPLSNSQQ